MPAYLSRLERAVADAAPAFFCRLGGGVERPAEGVVAAERTATSHAPLPRRHMHARTHARTHKCRPLHGEHAVMGT